MFVCPDGVSCSNVPVFEAPRSWSHSCLQMFLITPSVPSQLSSQNLWPRNRPRMLRERFRGDIRAGTESICVFARTCFAMSSYSISMGHPGPRGPHTRLMHSDPRHWYERRDREGQRDSSHLDSTNDYKFFFQNWVCVCLFFGSVRIGTQEILMFVCLV